MVNKKNRLEKMSIFYDKKGFMKTLEAFLAILVTVIFIILMVPQSPSRTELEEDFGLLDILAQDEEFRNCVITENNSCVRVFLDNTIDIGYYNYTFNISTDTTSSARIKKGDVYLKTYFIATNLSAYDPKILKLYYWKD
jgi:hypothetical protein